MSPATGHSHSAGRSSPSGADSAVGSPRGQARHSPSPSPSALRARSPSPSPRTRPASPHRLAGAHGYGYGSGDGDGEGSAVLGLSNASDGSGAEGVAPALTQLAARHLEGAGELLSALEEWQAEQFHAQTALNRALQVSDSAEPRCSL
jgi:hypothetical protein